MHDFIEWLKKNNIQLTDHQMIIAESYITRVSIESLGGHSNAFGKRYVAIVVNRFNKSK